MATNLKGEKREKEKERETVCGKHNEGRQEARERKREKAKETDVENHLGMDECSWYRWQLERKSLEI